MAGDGVLRKGASAVTLVMLSVWSRRISITPLR